MLTNGVAWNLYHLSFEEGIEYERVFAVDLASEPLEKAAELLGLLHRQSIRKGQHEEFWRHRAALSPESIGKALFTEEALRFIRREIRRRQRMLVDEEDLASAIHTMFSPEARERIGPLKIHRKKKLKGAKPKQDLPSTDKPAAPSTPVVSPRGEGADSRAPSPSVTKGETGQT